MSNEFIKTEMTDGVLKITMHDPATRNALGPQMAREMIDTLDNFERDPKGRVLLLTGTEPSFCSGANVKGFRQRIEDREQQVASDGEQESLPWGTMEKIYSKRDTQSQYAAPKVVLKLHELQKPSIAAVNGHAMGVGMGLSLGCDIRIAGEKAQFSEAFVLNGLIPADGSCWQLPRLIGLSNTLMLQYTGDRISGEEAYRMGLVSKVVSDDKLLDESLGLALRLASGPTQSHAMIKYLVHKSLEMDLGESLGLAHVAQEHMRTTIDHKEAVQAFIDKRKPNFIGK
ncbi:MAG TPA: hypothetical protein DEZ08_08750 [Dehalococcoidia bacterium]|jgi:2-(1,2-epoxy-1,2-dihydrophenyl)acetyl-CoA isomerase|nr:hypothetical protein [Dehalococcoidia bacterium]|tara:strand:+ start:1921 stop:2775 length:855 start_codon:yes stop_codon:yes gene_type:complete